MPPAFDMTSRSVEFPLSSTSPGFVNSPRTVTFLLLYSTMKTETCGFLIYPFSRSEAILFPTSVADRPFTSTSPISGNIILPSPLTLASVATSGLS